MLRRRAGRAGLGTGCASSLEKAWTGKGAGEGRAGLAACTRAGRHPDRSLPSDEGQPHHKAADSPL